MKSVSEPNSTVQKLIAQRDALLAAAKQALNGLEWFDKRNQDLPGEIAWANQATINTLRAVIAACEPSKSTAEGSHKP